MKKRRMLDYLTWSVGVAALAYVLGDDLWRTWPDLGNWLNLAKRHLAVFFGISLLYFLALFLWAWLRR